MNYILQHLVLSGLILGIAMILPYCSWVLYYRNKLEVYFEESGLFQFIFGCLATGGIMLITTIWIMFLIANYLIVLYCMGALMIYFGVLGEIKIRQYQTKC